MAKRIVKLDDLFGDAFRLFALHSSARIYTLAYMLNRDLKLHLAYSRHPLVSPKEHAEFVLYEYTDEISDTHWALIQNRMTVRTVHESGGLFEGMETEKLIYYHKEFRKIPYLLKVTGTLPAGIITKLTSVAVLDYYKEIPYESVRNKKLLLF